jgi:cytidine deaminase
MFRLDETTVRKLLEEAGKMLQRSWCPYSGFAVGAALLAGNGDIYTGCNIENAAFSPSICAERTAFAKAVSEGVTDFKAIAIVGGKNREPVDICPPCGACRQTMMEFCDPDSFRIILADRTGRPRVFTLNEMLPMGFGPGNLLEKRIAKAASAVKDIRERVRSKADDSIF